MRSLSLILPVYDDDSSVSEIIKDIDKKFRELGLCDYELLIFLDSGSAGLIAQILSELSKDNEKIRVFDKLGNDKIGSIFAAGIKNSRKDYVGIWSAYNQVSVDSFDFILPAIETSDIVPSYIQNPEARQWYRTAISKFNVFFLNMLFGLNFRYYHLCFFKTEFAKKVEIKSSFHSAMSEAIIWLAKSGARCTEVPFIMIPHRFPSKSHALDLRNIIDNVLHHLNLFLTIRIFRKRLELRPRN